MTLRKRNSKKNLQEKVQNEPEKELYFFDEARFGTHSKHGLGWFKKGSRTPVKTKLGYLSFYVYSATNHTKGKDFSLILPTVNKECMQLFINEFAKTITGKAIIVMDQAGWHKGIIVPDNIEIIFLPPYSPELNPVEKFWQHMKDCILKNKVYDTLQELEDVVSGFLRLITADTIKTVCNCAYV